MNTKLKPNFTQIPNIFFDEWLPEFEKGELKVLLYVMRRTYGFQKNKDKISMSQIQNGIKNLDKGTNLGRETITRSISILEEKGLLIVNREKNINTYSLNTNYVGSTTIELVPQSNRTSTIIEPQLVPQSNLQKKVSKESIQKKDNMYFEDFWKIYPKKIGKKDCLKIWEKKNLDFKLDKIISFIEKAKKTDRWKKGFIKDPKTFLNHESWEDDINAYNDIKKDESIIRI